MVEWLASQAGREVLAALPPYDAGAAMGVQTRLRASGVDPERAAAAVAQHALRARAAAKFGDRAISMLFTGDGLEQATRWEVARGHAQRYVDVGVTVVHDLGCGVGADAIAFAAAGLGVAAVEADPVTAAVASANLAPWPAASVRLGLAEDFLDATARRTDGTGVWLDPARRTPGVADAGGRTRRTFRIEDLAPSWEFVLTVAQEVPATGAKLAPAFPRSRLPQGVEGQWVSIRGEVVECAVWWGPLARFPGRTARVIGRPASTDAGPTEAVVTEADADPAPGVVAGLGEVGEWLYETDPAVRLAGLTGAVTRAVGGAELDGGLGYVTGGTASDLSFARRYRIVEAMPFSPKDVRAWLRRQGVTGVTLKKRGVDVDEAALRRQLKVGTGAGAGAQATILLTRVAGRRCVLVLDPE